MTFCVRYREIVNFSERHQASTGEIVADWLPLFGHSSQSTRPWFPLCIATGRDGRHGWCGISGWQEEERAQSGVGWPPRQGRLVVFPVEVGGRWCPETRASHSTSEGAAAGLEIAVASDLVTCSRKAFASRWWNCAQRWALTATHQRHTMCCATFRVLWSRAECFVGLVWRSFHQRCLMCVRKKKTEVFLHVAKTKNATTRNCTLNNKMRCCSGELLTARNCSGRGT